MGRQYVGIDRPGSTQCEGCSFEARSAHAESPATHPSPPEIPPCDQLRATPSAGRVPRRRCWDV